MKVKTSSHCETVVTSSFRACSFAMDDGGRCLADVINDPLLLQSFLESGSDDNSKDPQDGTSSESAVESPQVSRSVPATYSNHASAEHIVESEQMGYIYALDSQGFSVEPRVSSQGALCSSTGLGGVSLVVASSSVGPQTYQHASSSGATIHHIPSSSAHTLHPHSPASARPATPLSVLNKSPAQGPPSVHSMPPPSPLQMTRSPLPSHTPSPAPAWSPAPPVLSPVASRSQSMPPLTFQQSHNQLIQTTCNLTQFVTAIATPQALTQKLAVQQQQQLFLQQQVSPASQQQSTSRLTAVTTVVTTTAVTVTPPVVQLIPALQSNVSLPTRTSHTSVRPIQPKHPPQILPKPATCNTTNQFVSPAPTSKQAPPTPVTAGQRTVGVGIQPNATGQLVVGQGQSGVFSGPQGTILLNQIIPGVGQSPILIQGNLSNLTNMQGLQLTLRPPSSASPGQSLNTSNQNNATIIAALQNTSQHTPLFAPAKSQLHGQQTIVIPNNLAHHGLQSQNINLTSAIPNSGIMSTSSQGQNFLRSNIILSPRLVGPNQGLQLQQIQTPQGPIFACIPSQTIAVPHLPVAPTLPNAAIGNAQLAPVTLPMHGVMTAGQGVISGLSLQSHAAPSALQTPQQSLFGATVPFSSHVEHPSPHLIQVPPLQSSQIPTNHNVNQINNQPQSVEHSPKAPSPSKTSKGHVGLNLEDILKETGIVPENSPPLSPENSVIEESVPAQLQPNTVVPSQQLIAASLQGQVVLEQVSQTLQGQNSLSQMKLALAQDGSVILQPQNSFGGTPRLQQYIQSPPIQGRNVSTAVNSVIIPAVTSIASVSTSESSIVRNHANLVARLNSPPPVSVPDVSSLGVSSIGVSIAPSLTTTVTVTTLGNTVPLTVQSVNANNLPIASTGYVMQRTNVPERTFFTEEVINSQNNVHVSTEISNSSQSVQRINHMNSGFQSFVVSSESARNSMQNTLKTVQSVPIVSTTNCINVVQAEIKTEPNHNIAENKGAAVPTLNLPSSYQIVPNQKNQVQKLQKQINELSVMKYRTPEQHKLLQQSLQLMQKLIGSKINKNARNSQSQVQKHENDVKNIVQRCQVAQNQLNSDQIHSQQVHPKAPPPPLPVPSQSHEISKQITSNTQNVNLVNLLKQNSSVPVTTKHNIVPVTTCTVTVSSTVTTTVTSTVTVSAHPRIVNQVVTPVQQRLSISNVHQQKSQPESCQQPQPQVIVRLPKPQPQSNHIQPCPSIVQLKAAPPVKKVINTVPKTVLFNEQLAKDQNGAVCPDVNIPFKSKDDACRRLMRYHVYNSAVPSFREIKKADETFAMVSVSLLEKKRQLEKKFHLLQLKEGMKLCPTPDRVMLDRMFIEDEENSLKEDRAAVSDGKILSFPPVPASWLLKELDEAPCDMPPPLTSQVEEVTVKKEIDDDGHSTEFSDPMREDSDPVYKDDDNLEAPVIDSCADIVVPQHDENCERSPPTLKRIVIKPEKHSESDDESVPNNKRFKCNSYYEKLEPNRCERSNEVAPSKLSVIKEESDKEPEVKTNNKYPHVPLTRESYHSENSMDVMVTKIRKELNMSPMEMDDDDLDPVSSHVVDFEPPSGASDLADFEPPVARTEESCDSTLLYNSVRTNCDVKYDFEMLGCSVWDENYIHHPSNESDVTAGNIINDHANTSELDLSGLDGLDHLEESQPSIPNGIPELTAESDMNYIGYHIPKHQKRFQDVSVLPSSNCSSSSEQIRAIKSIIGTSADNRSYYGADEMQFLPINNKTSHTHTAEYGRSLDSEMGVSSNVSDPVVEAAVRSIQTLR